MSIELTALGPGEAKISVSPKWIQPKHPTRFEFPHIVVTVRVPEDGGLRTLMQTTPPKDDVAEALMHVYENFVHPSMRPFIERSVMEKWHVITSSEAYRDALMAYHRIRN